MPRQSEDMIGLISSVTLRKDLNINKYVLDINSMSIYTDIKYVNRVCILKDIFFILRKLFSHRGDKKNNLHLSEHAIHQIKRSTNSQISSSPRKINHFRSFNSIITSHLFTPVYIFNIKFAGSNERMILLIEGRLGNHGNIGCPLPPVFLVFPVCPDKTRALVTFERGDTSRGDTRVSSCPRRGDDGDGHEDGRRRSSGLELL